MTRSPGASGGISVIVVHFRTPALLMECLGSVERELESSGGECILVDNASGDDSTTRAALRFANLRVIANATNVGYARAANQAIERATGNLVLVLNADTRLEPGCLTRMIAFMDEHPECGVAGPRLEFSDGRLQPSCRTFYTLPTLLLRRTFLGRLFPDHPIVRRHLMLDWDHASVRQVDWILGAALLVRRSALEAVGPMDDRYFLYFEDVDWCRRMKDAGWSVLYCPDARILHHYARSSASPGLFNPIRIAHLESALRFFGKFEGAWPFSTALEASANALALLRGLLPDPLSRQEEKPASPPAI